MATAPSEAEQDSVVIDSPTLCNGPLRLVEKRKASRGWRSASYWKNRTMPWLLWWLQQAPRPLALLPIRLLLPLARLGYWLPSNPLRRACINMAELRRRAGVETSARAIYRAYLTNFADIARLILRLYRDGWAAVFDSMEFAEADVQRINALLAQHGGVALAIPHNLGSTFTGLRLCKVFPAVLVSKNSTSVQRTRIALDFFERLEAKVLMVRDGSAMQLSRTMIKLLRSGKVLALTVDLLSKPDRGVAAEMFGQRVHFPAWGTRIPSAIGVPIVPLYVRSESGRLRAVFGEALVTDDAEQAARHVAAFFEHHILRDPASWAFLAEKKWGRVLQAAAG